MAKNKQEFQVKPFPVSEQNSSPSNWHAPKSENEQAFLKRGKGKLAVKLAIPKSNSAN